MFVDAKMVTSALELPGNITIYTNMCEQARKDAYKIMCIQADGNKANAIIAMKYDATEVMRGVTEGLCYGMAVVVRKEHKDYQGHRHNVSLDE